MKTNEAGLAIIKHFEGFYETVYICPAGLPTIGYGHVVKPHENFSCGISKTEAEELLKKDLNHAEYWVNKLITYELNENQFSALVSFTFNVGSGRLQASTLRTRLNRDGAEDLTSEFMRWVFAGGRKLKGLERRRATEAKLFYA
jgi:lysozyme